MIQCWIEVVRAGILAFFPIFGGSVCSFTSEYVSYRFPHHDHQVKIPSLLNTKFPYIHGPVSNDLSFSTTVSPCFITIVLSIILYQVEQVFLFYYFLHYRPCVYSSREILEYCLFVQFFLFLCFFLDVYVSQILFYYSILIPLLTFYL